MKNLKFQLNRGDDLIKEMNDVLTHQIDVNPVENVLSAFATHSFEPEMPPSLLPTFKEKLNENLNLAKKSYNGLDLHVNSHRVNPNLVSDTKQSNEDEQIANVFGSMIGMPFGLEMGKLFLKTFLVFQFSLRSQILKKNKSLIVALCMILFVCVVKILN